MTTKSGVSWLAPDCVVPDFLYLGSWRCAFCAASLSQLQIRVVITLLPKPVLDPSHPNVKLLTKTDEFATLPLQASNETQPPAMTLFNIHVNVRDAEEEDLAPWFEILSDVIHQCWKAKVRCLVHCSAGRSRSPAVVLAYLILFQEKTLKEALAMVQKVRCHACPNPGFFRQLLALEESERGKRSFTMEEYQTMPFGGKKTS
eukprot:m.74820 g.74820  ORF g.74820 m.74820 type:complete len:202 (+) comp20461_c0_seq2:148-753(+)